MDLAILLFIENNAKIGIKMYNINTNFDMYIIL